MTSQETPANEQGEAAAKFEAALDAMEHHQRNVTYPILYEFERRLYVLGSGVLFSHQDRHFIITAAHLFDDDKTIGKIALENLAGPNTRAHGIPTSLGQIEIYKSQRAPFDYDMAIIELLNEEKITAIANEWRFLSVKDLGMPSDEPLFCLGGYPRDIQSQRGNTTHGPMFVVRTLRLREIPESAIRPVDLKCDFFSEYNPQGFVRQLGNKEMPSPALKGVSGGSLFQYDDTTTGLWSTSKTMKLVGIQSSASSEKRWFRAKMSNVIARLFTSIDREIGNAISAQLNP